MKKLILSLFLSLVLAVNVFGSEQKEFSVLWSLIESLHLLDWGASYEISQTDDLSQMMTKLMNQNSKYKSASDIMLQYANEKDEVISVVSKGIIGGALGLVDANNKILDKLRKMSNLDEEGLKDVEYTIAETNTQKKDSWEMILVSAGWSLPLIMEWAKSENPTGKIPFKLSEKDRKLLVNRIDELFGDGLKRYKNFIELSKQGKETNSNDSTYIIAGVEKIRGNLTTETYDEAKASREAHK